MTDTTDNNHEHGNNLETPLLEPVKKIRLYESIVKQIQQLISTGRLVPGQKLPPERELAEDLGVSRTSIREALRALEMMGYLESRVGMGGGTYIREASPDKSISPFSPALLQNDEFIVELLEIRLFLEIEAVRLAAIRREDHHLQQLQSAIVQMSREIEAGETGLNGDNEFHRVLADAAANRVLKEFVNMCGDLLEVEREEHLRTRKDEPRNALQQHRAIYEAIKEGDGEEAQRIMRSHITNISNRIKTNRARRHTS